MSPLPRVCAHSTCRGIAVPGTSRCPEHTRHRWQRRPSGPSPWNDPLYLRNRAKILQGNPVCRWCHRRPATTADHLKAVAEGGTHEIENLVPACERCNRLRGASLGGQTTKLRKGRSESSAATSKSALSGSRVKNPPPQATPLRGPESPQDRRKAPGTLGKGRPES